MKYFGLVLLITVFACPAFSAEPNIPADPNSALDPNTLLIDGLALEGAMVTIAQQADTDKWICTFAQPISDTKHSLAAGAGLEILSSGALERAIATMDKTAAGDFRLWGMITKFNNANYVYPIILLPVTAAPAPYPDKAAAPRSPDANDYDPNDKIAIPKEVLERLKPRRTVDLQKLIEGTAAVTNEDVVFTERSGFIHHDYMKNYVFEPDGLGRSVQLVSFRILPNAALEYALKTQASQPDRIRFKATGMLTRFNGQYYILLSRATRQFSHGNFAR